MARGSTIALLGRMHNRRCLGAFKPHHLKPAVQGSSAWRCTPEHAHNTNPHGLRWCHLHTLGQELQRIPPCIPSLPCIRPFASNETHAAIDTRCVNAPTHQARHLSGMAFADRAYASGYPWLRAIRGLANETRAAIHHCYLARSYCPPRLMPPHASMRPVVVGSAASAGPGG